MVTNVTSLTGNGLKDWLIQRVSAVYLAIYSLFLCGFVLRHAPMTFVIWHDLFSSFVMKISTIIALFMLLLHAWVGLWTVSTDYMKCARLRVSFQVLLAIWLMAQLIWGLIMVWGQ